MRATFRKPISIILAIKDPEKNIELANTFGNKVLNYLKTILGKFARDASIETEIRNYPIKMESLARKAIGETRLAKINEIAKKTSDPVGVIFNYKENERDITFMVAHGDKRDEQILYVLSDFSFKDTIPWDAVLSEYNQINECKKVITSLLEQEVRNG